MEGKLRRVRSPKDHQPSLPGPLASRLVGKLDLKQLLIKQTTEEGTTRLCCLPQLPQAVHYRDPAASVRGRSTVARTLQEQRHQPHGLYGHTVICMAQGLGWGSPCYGLVATHTSLASAASQKVTAAPKPGVE